MIDFDNKKDKKIISTITTVSLVLAMVVPTMVGTLISAGIS